MLQQSAELIWEKTVKGCDMTLEEYFVDLFNTAIMEDKDMPKNYSIWATHYGWSVVDEDTGEEISIEICEV